MPTATEWVVKPQLANSSEPWHLQTGRCIPCTRSPACPMRPHGTPTSGQTHRHSWVTKTVSLCLKGLLTAGGDGDTKGQLHVFATSLSEKLKRDGKNTEKWNRENDPIIFFSLVVSSFCPLWKDRGKGGNKIWSYWMSHWVYNTTSS